MTEDDLRRKKEKSKIYAAQPDLFRMREVKLEMTSLHGLREITYFEDHWSCTCDFFNNAGTCSHIMAAQEILGSLFPHI